VYLLKVPLGAVADSAAVLQRKRGQKSYVWLARCLCVHFPAFPSFMENNKMTHATAKTQRNNIYSIKNKFFIYIEMISYVHWDIYFPLFFQHLIHKKEIK
jgi:hypothetical protein